jgi:hypothetical protein
MPTGVEGVVQDVASRNEALGCARAIPAPALLVSEDLYLFRGITKISVPSRSKQNLRQGRFVLFYINNFRLLTT